MTTVGESVRFGPYRWDAVNRLLLREGVEVPLPPRVVAVFECLVEQPGRIRSRQELIDRAWKDAFVTDTSLAEAISVLRQALEDNAQEPRYIQTVHRRGYRFVAPVEPDRPDTPPVAPSGTRHEPSRDVGPTIGSGLLPWSLVALLGTILVVALWRLTHPAAGDRPLVARFEIALPAGVALRADRASLAVSPDGSTLAFAGCGADGCRLYLRFLHELEARAVPDTAGAAGPFFSPDGRAVGFFAEGKLKKAAVAGGAPDVLCDAPDPLGATWLENGRIVFAAHRAGGLEMVSEDGGSPSPLTTVDARAGEIGHRNPHWIAGTSLVIFTASLAWSDPESDRAMALSLADGRVHVLTGRAKAARAISREIVLFGRGSELQAARLDVVRGVLTTAPVPVAIRPDSAGDGSPQFAASARGTLLYVPAGVNDPDAPEPPVLVRGVERAPLPSVFANFGEPALDGSASRVAGIVSDGMRGDLWIGDATRGTVTRVTHEHRAASPVWDAEGRSVIYSAATNGPFNLWIADPYVPSARRLLTSSAHQFASAVTATGQVVFTQIDPRTRGDIWMTDRTGHVTPLSRTAFDERDGAISPDGRWLAYVSDESGRWQVYVKTMEGNARHAVSPPDAQRPSWLQDGMLTYVRHDGGLDEVPIGPAGPGPRRPRAAYGVPVLAVAPSGALLRSPGADDPPRRALVTLEAWQEIWRRLPPAVTGMTR